MTTTTSKILQPTISSPGATYFLPNVTIPSMRPLRSPFLSSPHIVSIIGAPLSAGQPLQGVDLGPQTLRDFGLVDRLRGDGWAVEDLGDVDFVNIKSSENEPGDLIKNVELVSKANEKLYHKVLEQSNNGRFVLTVGGDHSIGIGSMSGILKSRPETGIIWVDAHADINTPACSASGNIHGMVVSFLMDLDNSRKTRTFDWMTSNEIPHLRPDRIVYIGLRDVEGAERNILKQLGIKAFGMYDVDKWGIGMVMTMALDHLKSRVDRPIHLSFDIDSVDPAFAPSTGTRVNGGLSYREAYYICEAVAESGCLSSMDIVEINPMLSDKEGTAMTGRMAMGLCSSAMGNTIL
jgi:arginase